MRRTKRRLRSSVSLSCAAVLGATLAGAAVPAQGREPAFDFDKGNAIAEVVYWPYEKALRALVSADGSDATLVVDSAMIVESAWFDAIAPYHPTAVGIFSDLGRRPASERTTRNRNIAVIYAAYRSFLLTMPEAKDDFRAMMRRVGLDPDDDRENTTTPSGLGNLAARTVLEKRKHDGFNRLGDEGGREYNRTPLADYTGYVPVNTAYKLNNPSRWQPNVIYARNGTARVQQFVTPQMAITKPVSYDSPKRFRLDPPSDSDHTDREAYKRQTDEIINASANLTDRQKMMAEFFNDKIYSLGVIAGAAAVEQYRLDVEKSVHFVSTVDTAIYDATIATWHFKRKYDSVRPFSAVRYLYGDQKLTAWGGPGKGTVNDITGKEWRSYLNTADHPDYPSGSASLCFAFTQAARRFLGSDKIEISLPRPKGSSLVEPGVTPASDLTLRWGNWTDLNRDCGKSRVWAGVHFRSATESPAEFATQVGDLSYTFIQRKLAGR